MKKIMILPLAALLMVACGDKDKDNSEKDLCACVEKAGDSEEKIKACFAEGISEEDAFKEYEAAGCDDNHDHGEDHGDECGGDACGDACGADDCGADDVMEYTGDDSWEEALDEYEDYVDSYVSIMKKMKANPTDMSILEDYTELAEATQEWASKMDNISQNFGPNELNRMMKIQAKITKALSSY